MPSKRVLRVTLFRHGLAVDRRAWGKKLDLARPLTERGAKRVRLAAKGLLTLGARPAAIWSSPAIRALQTAKILAEVLGVNARELHEQPALLPDAAPDELLGLLDARAVGEVLCVGHAPHLDNLLAALIGLRRSPSALALKKSGAAMLFVRQARSGDATVRALVGPGVLRRMGRQRL